MPFADVNGVKLHYRLEGDGPETIVLVNGLADDLETWVLQMDALLAAGYRVLRYDNRGIGKSDRPAGLYTTKQMADDCKALVDELGISDFHLVGISMGGMISQEYAIAHEGDLRSLSLCCTYAWPGPFCSRMFALWADMAPVMGPPQIMRDVTLWAFTREFFETRGEELAEFEQAMAELDQSAEAYLAQLNSIQTHDTRDRIGAVKTPTLVLAGEEDILIPVEQSRRLHALMDNAEWATSKGGHAFLWEHPEPFNKTILDFLAKHRKD